MRLRWLVTLTSCLLCVCTTECTNRWILKQNGRNTAFVSYASIIICCHLCSGILGCSSFKKSYRPTSGLIFILVVNMGFFQHIYCGVCRRFIRSRACVITPSRSIFDTLNSAENMVQICFKYIYQHHICSISSYE